MIRQKYKFLQCGCKRTCSFAPLFLRNIFHQSPLKAFPVNTSLFHNRMESAAPENKNVNQFSPLRCCIGSDINPNSNLVKRDTKNQASVDNKIIICASLHSSQTCVCDKIHSGSPIHFASIICKEKETIPFIGPRTLRFSYLSPLSSPSNPRIRHLIIRSGKNTQIPNPPFRCELLLILIHGRFNEY